MYRAMLFLPGNSPGILANGDILGADAVIIDLEDAVAPDEKDAARILVRSALGAMDFGAVDVIVRINAVDENDLWRMDLEEIVPLRPKMIMPTKVGDGAEIRELSAAMSEIEERHGLLDGSVQLMPLIETAMGLENAYRIASADPRVMAIFLGAEDLTADLRCPRTKEGTEILYARSRMVSAARAAMVDVYDTPFTDVDDLEGLERDVSAAKALGFSGKAAISPRHVGAINRIFSPSKEELTYAIDVLEAIEEAQKQGKGVVSLGGKMIDAPVVSRAKQVIAAAKRYQGGGVR